LRYYPSICLEGLRKITIYFVGFEVLIAVVMKNSIFWNVMPRSPSKVSRHFGGTCHAGFVLGLFFDPEDGSNMFLLNVQWTAHCCIPEDKTVH
jgi:hypothetical protein